MHEATFPQISTIHLCRIAEGDGIGTSGHGHYQTLDTPTGYRPAVGSGYHQAPMGSVHWVSLPGPGHPYLAPVGTKHHCIVGSTVGTTAQSTGHHQALLPNTRHDWAAGTRYHKAPDAGHHRTLHILTSTGHHQVPMGSGHHYQWYLDLRATLIKSFLY